MNRFLSATLLLTLAGTSACSQGGFTASAGQFAPSLAAADGVVATDVAMRNVQRAVPTGVDAGQDDDPTWTLGTSPPGTPLGGN